jgi:hypothetical protein
MRWSRCHLGCCPDRKDCGSVDGAADRICKAAFFSFGTEQIPSKYPASVVIIVVCRRLLSSMIRLVAIGASLSPGWAQHNMSDGTDERRGKQNTIQPETIRVMERESLNPPTPIVCVIPSSVSAPLPVWNSLPNLKDEPGKAEGFVGGGKPLGGAMTTMCLVGAFAHVGAREK